MKMENIHAKNVITRQTQTKTLRNIWKNVTKRKTTNVTNVITWPTQKNNLKEHKEMYHNKKKGSGDQVQENSKKKQGYIPK